MLAFWYPVSQFSSDCHEILQPLLSDHLVTTLRISQKFYLVFQKLDHLACNAILGIHRKEVNGFIHVIEEGHK